MEGAAERGGGVAGRGVAEDERVGGEAGAVERVHEAHEVRREDERVRAQQQQPAPVAAVAAVGARGAQERDERVRVARRHVPRVRVLLVPLHGPHHGPRHQHLILLVVFVVFALVLALLALVFVFVVVVAIGLVDDVVRAVKEPQVARCDGRGGCAGAEHGDAHALERRAAVRGRREPALVARGRTHGLGTRALGGRGRRGAGLAEHGREGDLVVAQGRVGGVVGGGGVGRAQGALERGAEDVGRAQTRVEARAREEDEDRGEDEHGPAHEGRLRARARGARGGVGAARGRGVRAALERALAARLHGAPARLHVLAHVLFSFVWVHRLLSVLCLLFLLKSSFGPFDGASVRLMKKKNRENPDTPFC